VLEGKYQDVILITQTN